MKNPRFSSVKGRVPTVLTTSVAAILLATMLTPSEAAVALWDGGGADNFWSTDTNWEPNDRPSSNDDLQFAGSTRTSNFNDLLDIESDYFTVKTMTFNAGAASFTLQGNPVLLGGGIVNNSANLQTLNFDQIILTASQTWNAAAGDLAIVSPIQGPSFGFSEVVTPATLTITGAHHTTISGVISDGTQVIGSESFIPVPVTLVKDGSGILTLNAANTYTGDTQINAGELILNGSTQSRNVFVNSGGYLGGSGTAIGNVINNGIVGPGNSPGILTVRGNYTQNSGGTLRIEVAGLAATAHDLLAVVANDGSGGRASLAGALQVVRLNNFKLRVGDRVTFLTAEGGVNETFGTVDAETGTVVKAKVVYLPNSVVLEGTQGSFAKICPTPNGGSVGAALDSAASDPRAAELIGFLNDEPLDKLCRDFEKIAPEELAAIFNLSVALANVQIANLERRLEEVRAGNTGFSNSGLTLNGGVSSGGLGFAGPSGKEGKSGAVMTPAADNRWGVFVTGTGAFTEVDRSGSVAGYDLESAGFTLGLDYRVSPNFAIGLIAGFAHTDADLTDDGSLEVNGGNLGAYATVFGGGFYANAALIGTLNGYDTRRTALQGTARGSTDGGELNALAALGYDWKSGGLSIGPTASFQYTYVGIAGFTERGSLAALHYGSQDAESLRSALGLRASYDWKVGGVIVRPEIRAAWQHEYGDTGYSLTSSFRNDAGNAFTVTGPQIGRDSVLVGAGLTVQWNDRFATYAFYDGELGRSNYQSNNVSAGFRWNF